MQIFKNYHTTPLPGYALSATMAHMTSAQKAPTIDYTPPTVKVVGMSRSGRDTLARLMATEDIRVVRSATARTASFDLRNRVLTLPNYAVNEDLANYFTAHEVGHALYSPTAAEWQAAIKRIEPRAASNEKLYKLVGMYINVGEDIRIDRLMKQRFPGVKIDYFHGTKEFVNHDAFGLNQYGKGAALHFAIASMPFIDRINLHNKAGCYGHISIPFTEEEMEIVRALEKAATFEDMVAIVSKLYQNETPPPASGNSGEGENSEDDNGEGEGKGKASKTKKSKKPKTDKDQGEDQDQEEQAESDADGESDEDADGESESGAESGSEAESEEDSSEGESNGSEPEASDDADENDGDGEGADSSDGDGEDEDTEDGESGSGDADGESDEDADGESDADSDADGDANGGSDSNSSDSKSQAETDNEPSDSDKPSTSDGAGLDTGAAPPMPSTVGAMEEFMAGKIDPNGTDTGGVACLSFPNKRSLDQGIVSWKEFHAPIDESNTSRPGSMRNANKWLGRFTARNRATIQAMIQQFERKKAADQQRRTSSARTGSLDMNRMHGFKYNDDIFLRAESVADGKNHGMIMIVDFSSSMSSSIAAVMEQTLCLTEFCKGLKIPFEVYLFSDAWNRAGRYEAVPASKLGQLNTQSCHLLNVLSSKMTRARQQTAIANLLLICAMIKNDGQDLPYRYGMGGTPLTAATALSIGAIEKFKAENKTQILNMIWLTDGAGGDQPWATGYGVSDQCDMYGNKVSFSSDTLQVKGPSGRTYTMPKDLNYGAYTYDAFLRDVIRAEYGVTTIGFFLTHRQTRYGFAGSAFIDQSRKGAKVIEETARKQFEESGFCAIPAAGYNEMYLLDQELVGTDIFDAGKHSSAAFGAVMAKAKKSRVIMTRFAEVIAKVYDETQNKRFF